jgi:hypothetical protein
MCIHNPYSITFVKFSDAKLINILKNILILGAFCNTQFYFNTSNTVVSFFFNIFYFFSGKAPTWLAL